MRPGAAPSRVGGRARSDPGTAIYITARNSTRRTEAHRTCNARARGSRWPDCSKDCSTARGSWALYNYLFNPGQQRGVWIGAYYHDDYVKLDEGWKIQRTGYTYLFHEEWSRADLPSLRVVVPA